MVFTLQIVLVITSILVVLLVLLYQTFKWGPMWRYQWYKIAQQSCCHYCGTKCGLKFVPSVPPDHVLSKKLARGVYCSPQRSCTI